MEDVHFFYQKANRCYQLAWQAFDLRVAQRLNLLLRGHLAEFGVIAPQGLRNVGKLIAIVRDEGDARLPDLARQVLQVLAAQIEQLEAAVAAIEKQLMAWHKSNPVSQRLASVPGIGPIIAIALAATAVEPSSFRSGREFAAWLGLVRHRRPSLVVVVALANKTARIAWAVMHRHENYQRVVAAA